MAVYVAGVVAAGWYVVHRHGTEAAEVGARLYPYRAALTGLLDRGSTLEDVVWLGDSTLTYQEHPMGYPRVIARGALAKAGRRSSVIAVPGLDPYGVYALMGPVLARRPRLVVVIANLRSFAPSSTRSFSDLMAYVPMAELPRLLALPYGVRGATAPGLLLESSVGGKAALEGRMLWDGLRRSALDTLWPEEPRRLTGRAWWESMREYARPLDRHQSMVRFLGAAVDMATRLDTPVLVVVSPAPIHVLERKAIVAASRLARSVEALRAVVEQNGGVLLDLHDALAAEDFMDESGHFSSSGVLRMAALTEGPLLALLGLSPAAASR